MGEGWETNEQRNEKVENNKLIGEGERVWLSIKSWACQCQSDVRRPIDIVL